MEDHPGTFSQTYGGILTLILHINDVPCCWIQLIVGEYDWLDVHQRLERESVAHFKVLTVAEVLADKQVAHNKILCEQDCPGFGRLQVAKPPANFLSTPSSVRLVAPTPGERQRDRWRQKGRERDRDREETEGQALSPVPLISSY